MIKRWIGPESWTGRGTQSCVIGFGRGSGERHDEGVENLLLCIAAATATSTTHQWYLKKKGGSVRRKVGPGVGFGHVSLASDVGAVRGTVTRREGGVENG